jgi:hypothetical protein
MTHGITTHQLVYGLFIKRSLLNHIMRLDADSPRRDYQQIEAKSFISWQGGQLLWLPESFDE